MMAASIPPSTYTLENVYADALRQIQDLQNVGSLSAADVDIITGTTRLQDVLALINEAKAGHLETTRRLLDPDVLMERLKRFGSAIDILCQSMPQVMGLNLVGLVWGSLKFVITIAGEITDAFDAVFDLLDRIKNGLPAWETYATTFGFSDIQILRTPLVNMYALLITIGIHAVKFFNASKPHKPFAIFGNRRRGKRRLGRSFRPLIAKLERAGKEIESCAHAEHMHQSCQAQRAQEVEHRRAEEFRQVVESRLSWLQYNSDTNCPCKTPPISSNNAPVDLISPHFTGRGEDLDHLRTVFATISCNVPNRCAIYGMPGLGKTQLALQYTRLSFDQRRYSHIFWVSAITVERLNQGFAKVLDCVSHPDRFHPDQSTRLTAVRRWLEEPSAGEPIDWLLVFDNVDKNSLDFLREHLPRKNTRGNILFTTRIEDVARAMVDTAGLQHHTLELQTPDSRTAVEFLMNAGGMGSDGVMLSDVEKAEAEEVVNCVGRLPLAIAQAASFMKQSHSKLDTLLGLYRSEHKIKMIRWENDMSTYEARSVAATFDTQLKRLSRDANDLLNILSFLDPESIPIEIIVDGAKDILHPQYLQEVMPMDTVTPERRPRTILLQKMKKIWKQSHSQPPDCTKSQADWINDVPQRVFNPQLLAALICDPIELQKAIQELQDLSLVKHRSNVDMPVLCMHSLVRFMVQESVRAEDTERDWLKAAVNLVCAAFQHIKDPGMPNCWAACEMFVPHVQLLTRQWGFAHPSMDPKLIQANIGIAVYFKSCGRHHEAKALYKKVSARAET